MTPPAASPAFGYGLGLAAFLGALALRLALQGTLPPGYPFLTFFPAVILTAYFGGLGPGIATAAASALAAWYFFIPPLNAWVLDGPTALALSFFAAVCAVDIAVIHVMNESLARLARERARSAALAENRETLFQELQHRISNNLQLVSALLTAQGSSVADPQARRVLQEASSRLTLIARLHRRLHDPSNGPVELGTFLKDLSRDLLEASGASNIVCLVSAADGVALPTDRAIPVALIATELVSNALEHAFPGRDRGTITLDVRPAAEGLALTVGDDGAGLPAGFDLEAAQSLGLRTAKALARQIGGRLELLASATGTACRLTFPA